MNKMILYGRIANDPIFFKYENRDYCEVSLECDKSIAARTEAITCMIPCDDIETMKKYLNKGNYIAGDGFVGSHRDYTGNIRLHIILDNVVQYYIGKRGEQNEKNKF